MADLLTSSARNHGIIDSNGYALSISHTHAIVWPYTSAMVSPDAFTFTLPYPSARASDPLPLGALVSTSASTSEPGLVVVMPISGKITYWESISSATALDLMRQQRNGVEDSIQGMFHGETIVHILSAEPAGFILAFSTGRVAHLSVRDTQGRPSISVQFLRGSLGSSSSGIFGSIRTVFSHSGGHVDIVAVRCNRSPTKRGERIVVATTAKGTVHGWKVQRTGAHDVLSAFETKDAILNNIQAANPARFAQYPAESFEVVDFTFAPKGLEDKYLDVTRLSEATRASDSIQQLILLTSMSDHAGSYYCLCELILSSDSFQVGMVRPITTYSTPVSPLALVRPRIYVPKPALVAYLVFDRAIVIASIAALPETPESQLQEDSNVLPSTFEDVVDLQQDNTLETVASGFEETHQSSDEPRSHRSKTKNPATVFLVRGAGVLRVATVDIERFASERPSEVTARSKLEQAVVYGIKGDHLFTFSGRREHSFTDEEMCNAAIELSHDIISSKLAVFSTITTSMESHMQARAQALSTLMSQLNAMRVNMDRVTRWVLLQNAEKMTVAAFLWKKHEAYTEQRASQCLDPKSLVGEIVEYIHEDQKNDPDLNAGELDRVRHWFLHDVWRLEIFLAWAYEVVKYIYKDRLKDEINLTRYIYEAADLGCAALSGALDYREKKMGYYGLGNELLENGILLDSYEGLPEPWTATQFITNNIGRTAELCERWLSSQQNKKGANKEAMQAIRDTLPAIIDHWLISLQEQSRWALTPDNPETQNDQARLTFANECQKAYDDRHATIVKLIEYGLWHKTLMVAEKHKAVPAMAEIMVHELMALQIKCDDSLADEDEIDKCRVRMSDVNSLMANCFEQYGDEFAFATYEVLLEAQGVQAVLDFAPDRYHYATRFLRSTPGLERISWINDVEKEKDIHHAADTLLNLGLSGEQQVWNKKIELSLGKLALMAEAESDEINDGPSTGLFSLTSKTSSRAKSDVKEVRITAINEQLEMIKIQNAVYEQVFPTIREALDETAELQLAMEAHGTRIPIGHKALRRVFRDALVSLLKHEVLEPLTLIDLLTLVTFPQTDAETARGEQFFQALRVATLSLKGAELGNTLKLIWRRLYLRDDWVAFNASTNLQTDEAVHATQFKLFLFQTCYLVGHNCESPFHTTYPAFCKVPFSDKYCRLGLEHFWSFQTCSAF